ncbi:GNAT family N-acetyltransferase [Streptomyces pathocidini]|uniref:GNAT family N-acetyltransferase n=1 Tax=Streptomyces pathocidini TaxID=1650571 RepID=A0ABW7UR77_9ACTN|nr:GNAT family N-acetyltransferase [Streptomyces pathocidini]
MDFTTGGRLEVRITGADLGKRVSVRSLVENGPPGARFTDTVGVLTSWDAGVLVITRRNGETVRIPETSLVAGKVVPAAPVRRRGPAASRDELELAAARAWPPVESERLGSWLLRAAAGFTRRANSVLALGDPGMDLDTALARVTAWYAERGLPAYVQVATDAGAARQGLAGELAARGWTREVSALLRTAAPAAIADIPVDAAEVVLSRTVDEAWLARYQRSAGAEAGPEVRAVLGGGPSVWFATVPGEGVRGGEGLCGAKEAPGTDGARGAEGLRGADEAPGTESFPSAESSPGAESFPSAESSPGAESFPAAIGRCVVDGRWAGFAAVEVDQARRRQGLATAVMAALARKALDEGASAAYLAVEEDNGGAAALYDALGFTTHHVYHHFRAPRGELR